jgi:uncharacterized protein
MRLAGLIAAALISAFALVGGCRGEPATTAPAAAAADANPALWKITDADSTVYLFGTVHLLPDHVVWRSAAVDAALAKADTLYLETPTGPEATAAIGQFVLARGLDPNGPSVFEKLPAADAQQLRAVLARLKIPTESVAQVRPWLLSLQIAIEDLKQRGYDPAHGVETILEAEANRRGITKRYFETAAEQLDYIAGLSEADQQRMLISSVREIDDPDNDEQLMDAAWARGDVAALAKLLNEQMDEAGPGVRDALLTRRNAAWAAEINRLMQSSGVIFVAVGAAHLVGPDSVQTMLRAKGFQIDGPRDNGG